MLTIRYGRIVAGCAALGVAALLMTFVLTHTGRAKPNPTPNPQPQVQTEANREAIKPGNYATAINIHNPSPSTTVTLFAKAVVDGSQPSAFVRGTLAPDFAQEADCYYIENTLLGITPDFTTFKKGYVVIFVREPASVIAAIAPLPLDVVGVYTAEPPTTTFSSGTSIIPGIAEKLLPIAPRLEFVPASVSGAPGPVPAGQYYEYAAKFLCGEIPVPSPT